MLAALLPFLVGLVEQLPGMIKALVDEAGAPALEALQRMRDGLAQSHAALDAGIVRLQQIAAESDQILADEEARRKGST